MPETKKLNPQIAEVEIGIRNLRTIKIYPLSLADQLKSTDLIAKSLQKFFNRDANDIADLEFVNFLVTLIQENMGKILTMASDEDGEKLLSDLSNAQASSLAVLLYEMNFEVAGKNVASLAEKIKKWLPSTRPSPKLSTFIPGIDSRIASESLSKMEDSPPLKS